MDKSLLKKAAIQSVALMIAVMTSSYALQQYQTVKISASNLLETDLAKDSGEKQALEISGSDTTNVPVTVPVVSGSADMASSLTELTNQVDNNLLDSL